MKKIKKKAKPEKNVVCRQSRPNSVYAFIDSQNLNLGIQDQGWKLDFQKFRIYLTNKYRVSKAFLFIGHIEKNEELYKFLKKAGYYLVFKPILEYKKGKTVRIKGNVDAELVLHSMIEYPNYDKAIIISGDGDFYCLLEYLKTNNKFGNLIIPNKYKYSSLLRIYMSKIAFLNWERKNLERKKRGIISKHVV